MDIQFFASGVDSEGVNQYNFGWDDKPEEVKKVLATLEDPFFSQSARELMNSADEKKDGLLYLAHKKIFGKHLEAQAQPRGTCQEKGTEVRMADGSIKTIENIKLGDRVLSHRNIARKVIETKTRFFTGNMFDIEVEGYKQLLRATDKHLILTRTENSEDFVWKEMHEVTTDDYLVIPRLQDTENNPYQVLDITHYFKDVRYKISSEDGEEKVLLHYAKLNKKVKRFIEVNEEFAELIGLYLAEGSATIPKDRNYPDRVVFTYNLKDEEHLADRTVELLKKIFNVDSYILKDPSHNTVRVRSNYCTLGQFLMSFCGKGSLTKRVPTVFFNAKTSVKIKLIDNWIIGDGSKISSCSNLVCTSSFGMYKDFYQLSISCDIVPTYRQVPQQTHQNAPANLLTYEQDKHTSMLYTKCKKHIDTDIGICLKVKNIYIREVTNNEVYDIGIEEDHSYIAEGFAVHNCVSRGWSRACDYLQLRKMLKGAPMDFKQVSHSFIYGGSRQIGGMLSYQDGSVGAWAAKCVSEWGVCTREEVGDVPKGNDNLAVEWGAKGVPQKYKDMAKDNLARKVSMVRTAEEAKAALVNLFPIPVCSNRGFVTVRDSKGFCRPSGSWNHCGLFETNITTSKGIKYLGDIKTGEEVYGHDGKIHPVTHNFKNLYSGKIYTLINKHGFNLTFTEEHPILVYTDETEGISISPPEGFEKCGTQTICWTKKKLKWKKISDVCVGDLVVSPTLKEKKYDNLPEYEISKQCLNRPYVIDSKDSDISWLFGLFVGDGNIVNNHKVTFTLSNNKQISELIRIIRNKIGLTPHVYEKLTYSRVTIYSSILAKLFKKLFYNDKKEKIVPNVELCKDSFISGLRDADGNQQVMHTEIYNTSKQLIIQLQHMAIELGYIPKIMERKSYKGCYPNAKKGYTIIFGNTNKHVVKIDDNVVYKVEEIKIEEKEIDVYNLEVADVNSYIAEGLATHNCMLVSGYDEELRRFLIEQSWDQNMPSGPLYKDQPDNSFWIDWDVMDGMLRQEDSFVVGDLDAWMKEKIDWFI